MESPSLPTGTVGDPSCITMSSPSAEEKNDKPRLILDSPSVVSMKSDPPSEDGGAGQTSSPAYVLATPPRLLPRVEDDEDTTPIAANPSGLKQALLSRRKSSSGAKEWNKENVPIAGTSQAKETPNSRRGKLNKMLSEHSSSGCSPTFDNLLKRPLSTISEQNTDDGFTIKRPRKGNIFFSLSL